ncbi:MAG: hypothetical protein R3D02_02585 [Hyphomicrobiales bacterium]
MTTASELIDRIIAAHGGLERWRSLAAIEASFSSGGLAFASHFQPNALKGLRLTVFPHERRVELFGFSGAGRIGQWSPDRVAIVEADGHVLAERHQPRASFDRPIKNLVWDKLDILYFAGYALWNYLSFPFFLREPGITLALPDDGTAGSGTRLVADFSADIASHSPRQVFHFDGQDRLLRHDYTADVIGGWATAANLALASETVEGLRFYTRRKVYPRMGPRQTVLVGPLLVWIEIDDLAVRFAT